jgi:hypothetical protein
MSASPAPAQDRLSEAALIESDWNVMSYKDRAAWWMSAKWYGYQSTEAYRCGEVAKHNESCRYGEPGFFIATRIPYYEAQAAVVEVVAAAAEVVATAATAAPAAAEAPAASTAPAAAEAPAASTAPAAAEAPAASPAPVVEANAEPPAVITTEPVAEPIASDQTLIKNSVEGATAVAAAVAQPNTNSHNKKKKKNKRGGSIGAGKTIEISLH